ncbi:uncharacterized protein ACNS7B_021231 [Menidia menidia]
MSWSRSWALLLVFVTVTGSSSVIGSPEQVVARAGGHALLPCHVEPPFDVHSLTVVWIFNGSQSVHVYRSGADDPSGSSEAFRGRTSLDKAALTTGNISLTLSNVTHEDAGVYTCEMPKLRPQVWKANVTLIVREDETRDVRKDETRDRSKDETPKANPDQNNGFSGGEIVGMVIGGVVGVVGVAVVIATAVKFYKQRQRADGNQRNQRNPGDGQELHPLNPQNPENQQNQQNQQNPENLQNQQNQQNPENLQNQQNLDNPGEPGEPREPAEPGEPAEPAEPGQPWRTRRT